MTSLIICIAIPFSDVTLDSPVMQEEIFGPILPVICVSTSDEAMSVMTKFDTPLALYIFGKNRTVIDRYE